MASRKMFAQIEILQNVIKKPLFKALGIMVADSNNFCKLCLTFHYPRDLGQILAQRDNFAKCG